jgi:hypothetical protein
MKHDTAMNNDTAMNKNTGMKEDPGNTVPNDNTMLNNNTMPNSNTMPNDHTVLNIQIDRLVLDGMALTVHQQHQLRESLATSLKAHFAAEGIPGNLASLSSAAALPVAAIRLPAPGIEPAGLGRQIAASIYQGFNIQK